jgi:tellurite resistance protein TerC
MDVSAVVWWLTILGIVGLLAFDFLFHVRKAHVPTAFRGRRLVGGI